MPVTGTMPADDEEHPREKLRGPVVLRRDRRIESTTTEALCRRGGGAGERRVPRVGGHALKVGYRAPTGAAVVIGG
ncbi:MAG: hypothetical protein M3308_08555 [Actinomycetota bacterium]|nr:hypothetical protein [Actinomycetota bacterium]